MKMTSLAVSLCCCILFLLTSAKGEPRRTQMIFTKGQNLPFCPIDRKTKIQLKFITAKLKKEIHPYMRIKTKAHLMRVPRATRNCQFPFPNCATIALRVVNGAFAVHPAMGECCYQCSGVQFIYCQRNKTCEECIKERITCFNQCIVTHYCESKTAGTGQVKHVKSGKKGARGKTRTKGMKEAPGPRAKINLCPTTKVRTYGGSYCTKRSCYPIRL